MKSSTLSFLLSFLLISSTYSQQQIDVLRYVLRIEVNDSTNVVYGNAEVSLILNGINDIKLDLAGIDNSESGMKVVSVNQNEKPVPFTHVSKKLIIEATGKGSDTTTLKIEYSGVPIDGLIIGETMFGDRGFFGDNWPNRAHNWFPCIDHPRDKAYVEYIIVAPNHYQVVASGYKVEESDLPNNYRLHHWQTAVPISTKVMTIGITRFAVKLLGEVGNVPVTAWVYPQNRSEGFYDYAPAVSITQYFSEKIAPYPYRKLANVQSKTRFGGLENAGNIFYFENSVTGKGEVESLLTHEIAHQWFGNSATETDWPHLWLSEGFATYFTNVYFEDNYGRKVMNELLIEQRKNVIGYSKERLQPIVDTSITEDFMKLLNTNSYQKGSWVLHMLRREVGDEIFWQSIKAYYDKYKLSNADSEDLKDVFEQVSGQELDWFFQQWLYNSGQPKLKVDWQYKGGTIKLSVSQLQQYNIFSFPLDIQYTYEDGSITKETLRMTGKKGEFELYVTGKPKKITLDPDTWLLFEE